MRLIFFQRVIRAMGIPEERVEYCLKSKPPYVNVGDVRLFFASNRRRNVPDQVWAVVDGQRLREPVPATPEAFETLRQRQRMEGEPIIPRMAA